MFWSFSGFWGLVMCLGLVALTTGAACAAGNDDTSVGSGPPAGSTRIAPINSADSAFDCAGLPIGAKIPDMTLFTPWGQLVRLRALSESGMPIMLVAGSYTCPAFRASTRALDDIYRKYHNDLAIYVVYVVEAHPASDANPYNDTTEPLGNVNEGVLCRQQATYGERCKQAIQIKNSGWVAPQILVDGPDNAWWKIFGPAPNNAYVIDAEGRVAAKEPWFDNPPGSGEGMIQRVLLGMRERRADGSRE